MKTSRRLARVAIALWCVALFLPCCRDGRNAVPGYVGLWWAVYGSLFVLGIPALMTNVAVGLVAVELGAGGELVEKYGGRWLAGLSVASATLTIWLFGPRFAWGAYVWLASVMLACGALLTGERVTWRRLDGLEGGVPPL